MLTKITLKILINGKMQEASQLTVIKIPGLTVK